MSDEQEKENGGAEESFASLFESYKDGMTESVQVGDKVRGRIISVGENSVFVDTGTKIDGVVERAELVNEAGEVPFKEGDEIDLYVTAVSGSAITLSKAMSGAGGLAMLQDAFENHVPVQGRVKGVRKGGFDVEVMHRRAFCPVSQIDDRFVEDAEQYVGNEYAFAIIKFEEKGRNIVVSRRALLEREKREAAERFRGEVKAGDVMEGKVTRLMPYGAFVEVVPGVEGMVHVSELSWSRVDKPDEAVSIGDGLRVKVLEIGEDKKGNLRLSLSAKQVTGDPWDTAEGRFNEGEKVEGKVTRLTNFGAFVEIAPGIEGLIHLSEMSYVKRINRAEEVVQPGDRVSVKIKEFDLAKRRVSLSLRDAEGDPWQEVPEKFKAGQTVEGTLEKKEQFGWFINLAPGVTGLLPKSRLSRAPKGADLDKTRPGETVTVVVDEVRTAERKISLALPGAGDEAEEKDWKRFSAERPAQTTTAGPTTMGSLAEKLQAAMAAKDKKK